MSKSSQPQSFAQAMAELQELNRWFQQPEIDLEAGLQKLQAGQKLVQYCQDRLKKIENEFQTIKADFELDSTSDS